MKITYTQLLADSKELAKQIPIGKYKKIFGIPSGGIAVAVAMGEILNLELLSVEELKAIENKNEVLIVDDLVDSGLTLAKYPGFDNAVLYKKPHSPQPNFYLKDIPAEWVYFPHEKEGSGVEDHIVRIIEHIGENPLRDGLKDTPSRVVKSYNDMFSGYKKELSEFNTCFQTDGYDEMVILKDIEFYSTCEHHLIPFYGKAHIAYIPNEKIIGISKLARIVDMFSKRLQNQERITSQIAEAITELLDPKGVAVILEGKHLCMMARGVNKQNSVMKTSKMTGVFLDNSNLARNELLNLIN